jgi:hypothetical protein
MAPLFMKTISLTLKVSGDVAPATEFLCEVHSAVIEAEPGDDVTYQVLCPDGTYSQRGATTYALHLVGVQNWDAPGLARFLDEHDGVALDFVFQAHGHDVAPSAATPAKSGTCIGQAPSYGGEVETWAEYDVALPISGRPVTVTVDALAAAAGDTDDVAEPRVDAELAGAAAGG